MERNSTGWIKFKTKDREGDAGVHVNGDADPGKEILNLLPDFILKVNDKLQVTWANKTVLDLHENIVGRQCYEVFQRDAEVCDNCPCKRAFISKTTEKGIVSIQGETDLLPNFFEILGVPVFNHEGDVVEVIEIARDATEKIQSHRELQALSVEMDQALNAYQVEAAKRCDFILALSGEVKSDAEDLSEQLNYLKHQSDFRSADWIEPMIQINERLLRKVSNVNDFFSMEEASIQLMYVPFEITEVSDEVLNRYKQRARERNISFEIHQSSGIPKKLIGDVFRIHTMMMNVIENSLTHTQNGRIKIHFHSQSIQDSKQVRLQISITDTGMGLTEDRLEQIQKILSEDQTKDFFDQAIEMNGLGLLTVHNTLKAMSGSLQIESQYGRGTVVKMNMILGQKIEKNELNKIVAVHEEEAILAPSSPVNKKKILIAENDVVSRVTYKLHLQNHYELIFARNGKEAVELYLSERPDLVFIDIMMPVLNGFEAFDEIEKMSKRKVPMIACTARVIESEREYLTTYGFTDYMPKPVEGASIVRIANKHLK